MRIRVIKRLWEMAYPIEKFKGWVEGQVDNIVINYILIHIAKHNPIYDTMPDTISHWEDELLTAMSVVIGKKAKCPREAIIKAVVHILKEEEELDRDADVIRRKTWNKMRKEKVPQTSLAYNAAVTDFMKNVPKIAELVGGTDPEAIAEFVMSI